MCVFRLLTSCRQQIDILLKSLFWFLRALITAKNKNAFFGLIWFIHFSRPSHGCILIKIVRCKTPSLKWNKLQASRSQCVETWERSFFQLFFFSLFKSQMITQKKIQGEKKLCGILRMFQEATLSHVSHIHKTKRKKNPDLHKFMFFQCFCCLFSL